MSNDNLHTPYYIVNPKQFKRNCKLMTRAFCSRYPNYRLAYSFKTNYNPAIIDAAKDCVSYAEVVSSNEYYLARNHGFAYDRIIWNGVLPDPTNKLDVIGHGGIVNFDNIDEIVAVMKMWNSPHPISIGVRLTFDIGNGLNSRFGIEIGSDEYCWLIKSVASKRVAVKSVMCHISNARSADDFVKRTRVMANAAKELYANTIDIGGNMYGPMPCSVAAQYDEPIYTYDDYAAAIVGELCKHFPDKDVELITENGTATVSSSTDLVVSVVAVKSVKGVKYVVVDCKSSDVGFSCNHRNPEMLPMRDAFYPVYKSDESVIVGCTCLERDVIHREFLYDVHVGDKLIIKNVGAYGVNASNSFITPTPPTVIREYI